MNHYQEELKKALTRIGETDSDDWMLLFDAPWKSLQKTRTLAKMGISRLMLRGSTESLSSKKKSFSIASEGARPAIPVSRYSFEDRNEFLSWLKGWIEIFIHESEDMETLGFDQGSFTDYECCFNGKSLQVCRSTYAGEPVIEVGLSCYSMTMKNAVLKHIKNKMRLSEIMELPAFLRDMAIEYQVPLFLQV